MPLTPAAQHLKQCQNCFKSESKERHLQSCSQCKRAHYCSKECQKADWKAHKAQCVQNKATREAIKAAPTLPGATIMGVTNAVLEELTKNWVQSTRPVLSMTAFHALEIKRIPERCLTHILVVNLTLERALFANEPVAPIGSEAVLRAFTLADAYIAPLPDVFSIVSENLRPGLEANFDSITARTRALRATDPDAVGFAVVLLYLRDCSIVRMVPLGANMRHTELPKWNPAWKKIFAEFLVRGNVNIIN